MAYDDNGTNIFVLVDKIKKKIISYSITGRSEFTKFQELSKKIKSNSVNESTSKKRQSIKESNDDYWDSPFYYVEEIGGEPEDLDDEYAVFFSEDDKYNNRSGTGKRYFRGSKSECQRFANKKNKELTVKNK